MNLSTLRAALFVFFVAVASTGTNVLAQSSFSGIWTPRPLAQTDAGAPGRRGWIDLIFDPVLTRPVLFGGSGGTYMNDILEMDFVGNRWVEIEPNQPDDSQIKPLGPPSRRDEHAVEFDSYNRLYWSFGGSGAAQVVIYDSVAGPGSNANSIVDTSLPQSATDYYKDWFLIVHDQWNDYGVYVVGYDPSTMTLALQTALPINPTGRPYTLKSQSGGGTWYYNPATRVWKGFDAPSFGYVGAKPATRLSPAMAYSSRDRAMVVFGGQGRNDTWALDVQSKTWIPLQANGAAGAPPRRAQILNSMVYDPNNDVFVLFGGECNENPACGAIPYGGLFGDTWIYRLSTNQWTLMAPTVSPPASHQHTLSYDAANQVVVLFGGETSDGLSHNDVWIYDVPSNTWSQASIAGQLPAPRALHAMVYDPVLGEHVIYGGRASYASVSEVVWSLQLTRLTGNAPPVASFAVNPGSGNISTTFQFDGSASRDPDGTIVSYAWNFGDGTTGTGATTSHRYTAAGNYTIRLTVTDNLGATGSNESTINVSSGAIPTTTALTSSQNPAAEGSSITFTATVSGSSPTGTVAFTDNGTAITGCASIALAGTTAQCATAALTTGSHAIVASYGGDAANAGSSSTTLTQTVTAIATGVNVALASNGGVASASSTYTLARDYSPSGTNNGDRKGANWERGGGWADATADAFPDWLQITFTGAQTISEIDVFTLQDNYTNPVEPLLTTTFRLYGITAFEVQFWTGSAWAAVPNGTVTGNNNVWRQFTFPPITTDRIRVVINNALANYSRITEVEAWTASGGTFPTPTTTVLSSSQNPAAEGSSITFTATVSGSSPTGTVAFTDNGTAITGCASIALAGTTAQCATAALTTGSHAIVASYGGDAANAGSSSTTLTQTVTAIATGVNVALASNGGVASASSTYTLARDYSPSGTNNGDRKGANWERGGGWADATADAFPDWLQVTFASAQTISEIDVFTLQDNYGNPIEPTLATTFSAYGITAFEVQFWTGSAWAAVPNGTVTGNNNVWRQFTFPPITTDRIRVVINNALANYSRITEVEAWTASGGTFPTPTTTVLSSSQNPAAEGSSITFTATVSGSSPTGTVAFTDNDTAITGCASIALAGTTAQCAIAALTTGSHAIVASYGGDAANAGSSSTTLTQTVTAIATGVNVALASNGGVASASSTYTLARDYSPSGTNNGDRKGANWERGGGWADATADAFPDWLQITFTGAQTISEIDVFTLQDNYTNPVEPLLTTTFRLYGITAFEVQFWTGSAWAAVPNGTVTGNNNVWRQFTFPPITTDRIRVVINNALANYSRITEVEAWTASGGTFPTPTTTVLSSSQNPAAEGSSITFTATVSGSSPTGTVAFTDNDTAITGCASIALAGTTAQCATAALTTGSHAIVASYGGDAANAGSSSTTLTQTVTAIATGVNVALASNGGVASASSTYTLARDYSPSGTNNGDRKGANWERGGGWADATADAFPDWLQITFTGAQTISEIDVFTLQDNYTNPVEPLLTTTFRLYGITAFEVQFWTGSAWAAVPNGTVTGNNNVWRQFTFPPITTDRIRVVINNALANYSRITEVEAWTP